MSKKYLTISLCFLLVQIYVFAQDNFKPGSEPAGFRDIEWGTNINTLNDMEFIAESFGYSIYSKKNDLLKFEGVDLKKIEYTFIGKELWSVKAVVSESNYNDDFKKAIFEKYGKVEPCHSFQKNGTIYRRYCYEGELTKMILGVNTFRNVRVLAFTQSENNVSKWKTYRNEKYGYEIRYPLTFTLRLLDPETERDGKYFRIDTIYPVAVHNGLTVNLYPGKKMIEIAASDYRFNATRSQSMVKINGKEMMKIERAGVESQELVYAVYILDGVKFEFDTGGFLSSSLGEKIVSTFKFYK